MEQLNKEVASLRESIDRGFERQEAQAKSHFEELVAKMPGLHLAGNAYHGIGIPDCVRMGQEAAIKISAGYKPELQPA